MAAPWRPTREQVAAAEGQTIPDVLEPSLDVVFCGVNPSLYSGAVGHHFARPGNRFWKALHQAAFTDRVTHHTMVNEQMHFFLRGLKQLVLEWDLSGQ